MEKIQKNRKKNVFFNKFSQALLLEFLHVFLKESLAEFLEKFVVVLNYSHGPHKLLKSRKYENDMKLLFEIFRMSQVVSKVLKESQETSELFQGFSGASKGSSRGLSVILGDLRGD